MLDSFKNFDKLFPAYKSTYTEGECSVIEPNNFGTNKLQKIIIKGINAYSLPHDFAEKTSSFANITEHRGILRKDCDGIFFFSKNDQKYMVLCELKSTFDTADINKARDQIIGT